MNAPDMHLATLAAHEHQTAIDELLIEEDEGRTYSAKLAEAFHAAIKDGPALMGFDNHTEALYSMGAEIALILNAYRQGTPLLAPVEALYDGLRERFEDWKGEEIRERAEAAILARGDDD